MNNKTMQIVKSVLATTTAACLELVGGGDTLSEVFFIIIILDYISGVTKSIILGETSTGTGLLGALKKFLYIIVVVTCVQMDKILGSGGWARNTALLFFIMNDGLSVLENAAISGVKLPVKLLARLQRVKEYLNTYGHDNPTIPREKVEEIEKEYEKIHKKTLDRKEKAYEEYNNTKSLPDKKSEESSRNQDG